MTTELTTLEAQLASLRANKEMNPDARDKEMRQLRKKIRKIREAAGLPSLREELKATSGDKPAPAPRERKNQTITLQSKEDKKAARRAARQEKKRDERGRRREATEELEWSRTHTFVTDIPESVLVYLKEVHGLRNLTNSHILYEQPGYSFLMEEPANKGEAGYNDKANLMISKYKQRWNSIPEWFAVMAEGKKQILAFGPTGKFIQVGKSSIPADLHQELVDEDETDVPSDEEMWEGE